MKLYHKIIILNSIILSLFFSCNKKEDDIEYYKQSKNKYKVSYHFDNYDSVVVFYKNGKIFKTGKQDLNGKYFGKWNYYTTDEFLSNTQEFLIINKKVKLNQQWYYNIKGDTMYYGNKKFNIYNQKEFREDPNELKRSIFVRFGFIPEGDTLSISEPFKVLAEDGFPFWTNKDSESYVVLAKENYNFNSDFSNESQVKLDTFFCVERDKINKGSFPNSDQKHTVAFGRWFVTPGKKELRGYMVEYCKNNIIIEERRTYFEKIIYVKDTVK